MECKNQNPAASAPAADSVAAQAPNSIPRMRWAAGICIGAAIASQYDEAAGFWPEFSRPSGEFLPAVLARALPLWISAPFSVICLIIMVIWAIWESTLFPRHVSMTSRWDKIRIFVQLIGDLLLSPVFFLMPGEVPEMHFQQNEQNNAIVSMCPSFKHFKHTPWLRNPYLSFASLMCFDMMGASPDLVERELLQTADGGHVALDWWQGKPEGVVEKLLFLGSTFTGDALPSAVRDACQHFASRGWHVVVFVKRGCGMSMPNTQDGSGAPWCLGGLEDMNVAVDHVAGLFPKAFICGLGLSCGAAQLRNYVNAMGANSKIHACVNVDAAEEWETTMASIDKRVPLLGFILADAATKTVANCRPTTADSKEAVQVSGNLPHEDISRDIPKWYGLLDFVRVTMAPAHGFKSTAEDASNYLRSCQPADPTGCRVPTLELFTYNDTLLDPPCVQTLMRMPLASPHIVTCATKWGTHIIRWQGVRPKCWTCSVACEFLEASRSVTKN